MKPEHLTASKPTRTALPIAIGLGLGLALACAWPAHAQHSHGSHGSHGSTPAPAAAAAAASGASAAAGTATELAEGVVRRIDKAAGKITLRHGEIKHLDMPPMTMVFQVRDPALLDAVTAGAKVRFRVEQVGSAYVVTSIQAAP